MASNSAPRPTSIPLLLAAYLGLLIGGVVLLFVIIYVVEEFFKSPFPNNSAMGFILIAVAAMSTGSFWYNREQANPASGRKWLLALVLTIFTAALQVGLVYLVASAAGEIRQLAREFGGQDQILIIGVLAGFAVIELLLIRASIWWGVRNAIKQSAAKAAKAAKLR